MTRKPIVAYIENDSSGSLSDDNPDRDALSYFLRKNCGCEVIQYMNDYYFKEDLPRLKKYSDCHQLILVIVKQEKYFDQHKQVLRLVRAQLCANLPVVVIPNSWDDKQFDDNLDDSSVYVFARTDIGLIELVDHILAEWKPRHNWLGAETAEDQAILIAQLENAYCKHHLSDDEGMFGTPDHNHMIVAEALRIKSLPVSLLKAEFDDTIEEIPRMFAPAQLSAYKKELEKIRKLNDEERKLFNYALMRTRGYEPTEGGGVFVCRSTCGDNINGFAIDPVTLETLITYRSGMHHIAGNMLAQRIQVIEVLQNRKGWHGLSHDKKLECRQRLITGLIFSKIDGFVTPILQLYTNHGTDPRNIHKVARFLKEQQILIPIDHNGRLIKG